MKLLILVEDTKRSEQAVSVVVNRRACSFAVYSLMFPVPDQPAILVYFLDAVEGDRVNIAVRIANLERKMVTWDKLYLLQRYLN